MATKSGAKKMELDLAEVKETVAAMQEVVAKLDGQMSSMSEATDKLLQKLELLSPQQLETNASAVTSDPGYDKEAWSCFAYLGSLLKNKLVNLHKNQGIKNSRGNVNQARLKTKETLDLNKEFQGLCLACFRAGKNPEECVTARPQDVRVHRKPGTCVDPLPMKATVDARGNKTNKSVPDANGANHVEGAHYAVVRYPGVSKPVEFVSLGAVKAADILSGVAKHPGWTYLQPVANIHYVAKDMHQYFEQWLEQYPGPGGGAKDVLAMQADQDRAAMWGDHLGRVAEEEEEMSSQSCADGSDAEQVCFCCCCVVSIANHLVAG